MKISTTLILLATIGLGAMEAPALGLGEPSSPVQLPASPSPLSESSSGLPTAFSTMENHFHEDATTARMVADLLEHQHYLQAPLDLDMSRRWLKNYIQALDPTHLFFLQSDIDEFNSRYGADSVSNNLAGLLVQGDDDKAALMPAIVIYERFLQRMNSATNIARERLKDKFDFTLSDTYSVRYDKSDWFKDQAEYESYWKTQAKEDVLQNLLDKAKSNTTDPQVSEDLLKKIDRSFDSLVRNEEDQDGTDGLQTYLNALCHAYDPHTDYFSPAAATDFQAINLDVAITGIGAELRPTDGFPTVEDIVPGGPAAQDKRLQKDDRIIAVGQGSADPVETVNMPLNKVVSLVRGNRGTLVHLVVIPAGANSSVHRDIVLKRDKVALVDSIAKADIIQHKQADGTVMNVGVIKLPGFYSNTGQDVKRLLIRLKEQYNIAGVILDLRTDGGGLLDQALELTGLFAGNQPVVQIRDSANEVEALATKGQVVWGGPLIVMTNKFSASASEIVAGALQDYGRALIVGDKSTHGKGTVQTFVSLDQMKPLGFPGDPGKLKLTVEKFYRVAGGSTQQMGVIPDIILPSKLDAFPLGETNLPYYLPYDTISKVPYIDYNLVAPYLSFLKQNSQARVDASPDFNYVKADVAYYKQQLDETTRSLNFSVRLQDQNTLYDTWKKETVDIAARNSSRDPILELTLDEVIHNQPATPPIERKPLVSEADGIEQGHQDPTAAPSFDPQLTETVSIMSDYCKTLKGSGAGIAETISQPTATTQN